MKHCLNIPFSRKSLSSGLLLLCVLVGASASLGQQANKVGDLRKAQVAYDRNQKRIFSQLEPAEKVDIWRDQLSMRAESMRLNNDQLKVVKTAFSLLSESLYEMDRATAERFQANPDGSWARFVKSAKENFSEDEIVAIFYRLDSNVLAAHLISKPMILKAKFLEGGNCDCLDGSTCCGMACGGLPGSCTSVQSCGWMESQWCTGKCGALLEGE